MVAWKANTRWSVEDSREIERAASQLEDFVAEAFRTIVPDGTEQPTGTWRGTLSRRFSLYDRCEVVVTLTGAPEEMRSKVEISVAFEASPTRVEALMMSTTSIIGIPFGWGWRLQSMRASKKAARQLFEAFWRALLPRLEQVAYR
jgi:hypothetical protein